MNVREGYKLDKKKMPVKVDSPRVEVYVTKDQVLTCLYIGTAFVLGCVFVLAYQYFTNRALMGNI